MPSCLCTQAQAQKTYINGIDPNYPPFAYIDEKTGQPAGFDVESMNWIAKKMGFKVEHKPMAWDGIIPSLLAKQIDMIASGMSITDKRRAQVDFSDPYWQVYRVFLVRKDSTLTPKDILSKPVMAAIQPRVDRLIWRDRHHPPLNPAAPLLSERLPERHVHR